MYCQKCGKENSNDAQYCASCGANLAAYNTTSPVAVAVGGGAGQMTFTQAISTCFAKYADFKGRAARPEYWWFYLFSLLLIWGTMLIDNSGMISGLANLALMLPSLAAGARRLHDTGRSGWWLLLSITLIGLIPLIYWLASKGSEQANEYGNPV